MIRSSEYFTFNGERSDYYGILNVNVGSSGLQSEPFAASRGIKEQRIRGNDRPYFMGVELEPLEFTVSFMFEDKWDESKIRNVARWLTSPKYYAPMVFADLDRIFYCICVDSPELIHNCLERGYIDLKFRCIDAYTYTRVYNKIVDLSQNPAEGTVYTFENFGDVECKPIVKIEKVGNGDVSFFNQSNGNAEMTFKNLIDKEIVTIDCESRIVESNIPLIYRYNNMVGDYLSIPIYNNYLLIKGTCKLTFTYQLKRIQ